MNSHERLPLLLLLIGPRTISFFLFVESTTGQDEGRSWMRFDTALDPLFVAREARPGSFLAHVAVAASAVACGFVAVGYFRGHFRPPASVFQRTLPTLPSSFAIVVVVAVAVRVPWGTYFRAFGDTDQGFFRVFSADAAVTSVVFRSGSCCCGCGWLWQNLCGHCRQPTWVIRVVRLFV